MDSVADDLMENGDLRSALQRMFRWGREDRTASGCPASRSCWTSCAGAAARSWTATTSDSHDGRHPGSGWRR